MAATNRPDKKPRWATVPTINGTTGKNNVIEPTEGKKDLGWDYLEKAARNFMNWVHNKTFEWIEHIDTTNPLILKESDPTPDLSFLLQGGTYFRGITLVTIADQALGPLVAPTVNPRIDRVVLNRVLGTISILTGAESGSPVPPALGTDQVPLSQIALVVAQTQIFNVDITPEKPYVGTTIAATETEAGIAERATQSEVITGTDTIRYVSPDTLQGKVDGATVTNYIRGQITQIDDTVGASSTLFDHTAISTSWETVGPTASGATNIWTAMDDIPSNAVAIEVRTWFSLEGDTDADSYTFSLYGQIGGNGGGIATYKLIANGTFRNRSGLAESMTNLCGTHKIPLDGSGRFELRRAVLGTSPTVAGDVVMTGWVEPM